MRSIYILSAEYSAPEDVATPREVFARARRGEAPPVDALMARAGRRALAALPAGVAPAIEHLLVTTMPYTDRRDADQSVLPSGAVNLPAALKHQLGLGPGCQARFELGTSDAGAGLFASAFRLLQGLPHPSTAVVVAGQTMFGGVRAIHTVAQVIDPGERRGGLRMIPVGDALLDAQWARLMDEAPDASGFRCLDVDGVPAGIESPDGLATLLARHKRRLATEYGAAMRHEPPPEPAEDPPLARWLRRSHVAPAATGACAVVLTSDERAVRAWLDATGHGRVVRVLGVGEGDDDPRVGARPEPLLFLKAMRQALVNLRRSTGVGHGFVRQSAFAVLHDAFPSIELAFLQALGFSPIEALERAVTEWPNPFGGLTAFGHALAASGLVQIAKAFHIFVRPPAYVTAGHASHHPDYTRGGPRVHCVTTSVGGPMTHIVATLLEAVAVPAGAALPADAIPRVGRRHDDPPPTAESPELPSFEGKTAWVARVADAWRAAQAQQAAADRLSGLGVVEGRTALDLRTVPLPLPQAFLDAWTPAFPLSAALRAALAGDDQAALENAVAGSAAAAGRATGDLWMDLRLPAALVSGGGRAFEGAPRALCLVPDGLAVHVGDLVAVARAGLPHVVRVVHDHPELVAPWHRPAGGRPAEGPFLPPDEAGALVSALRRGPMSRETLGRVFDLTEGLLADLRTRAGCAPPPAAVALTEALVLAPDPDRWRLADAIATLGGPELDAAEAVEVAGYCEFNVVRVRAARDQALAFATVHEAIGRARGLLGGTHVHPSHVADTFAVAARGAATEAELWPRMLRFAQAVYGRCLSHGVPVRAAVSVATGPVVQRGGALLALPGGGQLPVHLVMHAAPAFGRAADASAEMPAGDDEPAGHGVAVVVVDPDQPEDALRARCAALWHQAGGVRPLEPVDDGWLPPTAGVRAWYAIRALRDPGRLVLRPAGPFEV